MELKLDPNVTYALALEGGGARGAYQVGAWRALREAGVRVSAVSGTSIPLNKGSDADSIVSAITASGIENAALSQWDSYYNINTANYNRVVTLKDSYKPEK